jgi:uncharacterized RDD family membrane protein YckC
MNTAPAAVPAALHWRLLALAYDLLPVAAIWFAVAAAVLVLRGNVPVTPGSAAAWAELGAMLLAGFGYFGLSWRRGGQTLGMRAWRLRLVDATGGTPRWPALALRYAVAGLSFAAFGLGVLWSLVDRERRAWHDLASGTRVLRLPRR